MAQGSGRRVGSGLKAQGSGGERKRGRDGRVEGLGFSQLVLVSDSDDRFEGSGGRFQGLGLSRRVLRYRVQAIAFRVQTVGFRVQDSDGEF